MATWYTKPKGFDAFMHRLIFSMLGVKYDENKRAHQHYHNDNWW